MKCPQCKTVIPRARPLLSVAERTLPEIYQMIADVAGLDAVLAIATAFGGKRVYFHTRQWIANDRPSWLVDLLGKEKALLVADIFVKGEVVVLPLGPAGGAALKYFKIKAAKARGLKVDAIAREVGVTRRTVFYYFAEIRREEGKNR
jgi:hypothetical protein